MEALVYTILATATEQDWNRVSGIYSDVETTNECTDGSASSEASRKLGMK